MEQYCAFKGDCTMNVFNDNPQTKTVFVAFAMRILRQKSFSLHLQLESLRKNRFRCIFNENPYTAILPIRLPSSTAGAYLILPPLNNKKTLSYVPEVFGSPGGLRKVREAGGMDFLQISSKSDLMVPSCDPKTKKLTPASSS